jgi:hypothetical protein
MQEGYSMQNLVGEHVPSEGEIQKIIKDIEAIDAKLEKYTHSLNAESRQRALKPPDGSEATTKLIAKLMTKHGVSLPNISAEDMEADRLLAERLQPVAETLTALLRKVHDTLLEAGHERWYATTAGYTALVRLVATDPALETALKPALEAFGVGRKRKPRAASPV